MRTSGNFNNLSRDNSGRKRFTSGIFNNPAPQESQLETYTFGLYENEVLIEQYKTQCDLVIGIIEQHAKDHATFLSKKNPQNKYEVKKID